MHEKFDLWLANQETIVCCIESWAFSGWKKVAYSWFFLFIILLRQKRIPNDYFIGNIVFICQSYDILLFQFAYI